MSIKEEREKIEVELDGLRKRHHEETAPLYARLKALKTLCKHEHAKGWRDWWNCPDCGLHKDLS